MRKLIPPTLAIAVLLMCANIAMTQAAPAGGAAMTTERAQKETVTAPSTTDAKTRTLTQPGMLTQGTSEAYSVKLEQARGKAALGDYKEAIADFQDVTDKAHLSNDAKAEAESSMHLARTIELSYGKGLLDEASFDRAKTAYSRAIEVGDASQQASARNGLATLLLHKGDPAGALAQLQAINLQQVDASHRAVYRYNLGVANEKAGKWTEAYSSYIAAIADKPDYESSAEATFRLLRSAPTPHVAEAVKFNEALLSAGQISFAGTYTRQLLEIWAGSPDSQQLLAALLRYYAVSPLTLEDLRERELPYLNRVVSAAPHLGKAVGNLQLACFGRFAPVFEPYQARDVFGAWGDQEWQREAMAGMLKRAGDLLKEKGSFQDALARYSAAWALGLDSDAALYAASLLHDQRPLIDANQELFDQLLRGIIEVKGMDYRRVDWPNILRMHTLLGSIFEQEKKWGSETELRSAIFQWRHAIDAESQIRKTNPNYPRSPMLYVKLANAYREKGDPQAVDFYLSAAEVFAASENAKQARSALEAASSLAGSKSASVQQRMQRIDAAITAIGSEHI